MKDTIQAGSIAIFINISEEQEFLITESVINRISSELKDHIKSEIKKFNIGIEYEIEIEGKRGCLIEWATIVVAIGSVYTFVKDYKDLKDGLCMIIEDLKKGYLKIVGKKDNSMDTIHLEHFEILKKLPPEFRKLYEAGVDTYFEEKQVTLIHKVAIMRDDLLEPSDLTKQLAKRAIKKKKKKKKRENK